MKVEPDEAIRTIWLRDGAVSPDCADCGVDTWAIGEFYVVHAELWDEFGVGPSWGGNNDGDTASRGCLCIGCLEARMGRPLTREDFTDNPVMYDAERWGSVSDRLHARLADVRGSRALSSRQSVRR